MLNEYTAASLAGTPIGRTYVATQPGERLVLGYDTVSARTVSFDDLPKSERKHLPKYPVPTVHIGRLAVDNSQKGQSLGETLLMHALEKATRLADEIGIRAVEVVAKGESAKTFYERYGFRPLLDDELHLYLSTKELCGLFGG